MPRLARNSCILPLAVMAVALSGCAIETNTVTPWQCPRTAVFPAQESSLSWRKPLNAEDLLPRTHKLEERLGGAAPNCDQLESVVDDYHKKNLVDGSTVRDLQIDKALAFESPGMFNGPTLGYSVCTTFTIHPKTGRPITVREALILRDGAVQLRLPTTLWGRYGSTSLCSPGF